MIVACALMAGTAIASPTKVAPPFDASTSVHTTRAASILELIRSADRTKIEEGLAQLERDLAKWPTAGDTDYAVALAARAAARLCRLEDALAYYTVMRTYFVGSLDAGANGAQRDWTIHLAITRAYVAKCAVATTTLAKLDALDKGATPMARDELYTHLTASALQPPPAPVDRDVGVVGAWRFDPALKGWVSALAVTASPRPTKSSQLPTRTAKSGVYTVIWKEPGRLIEQQIDKGRPDCRVAKTEDLDELDRNIASLHCVPGRGLMMVPPFNSSLIAARELSILEDAGEAILRELERAHPTPDATSLQFRRDGRALLVRSTSDYGRTLVLDIDRMSVFDPQSAAWKPFVPTHSRIDLKTQCAGCDLVSHHRRGRDTDNNWVPFVTDSAPSLLHVRGTFGGQPLTTFIFNGSARCQDVKIGTRKNMVAMCVPDNDGATARFVPPPP